MTEKTKKILFISGVAFVVIATGLTMYFILNRKKKGTKKLKNPNPSKILIVGDSQSAIKNASGSPITYTYPNILKKQFPDKQIDVLALGGKTTNWMLENLPAQLQKNKYDRVYIYGGGNDTSNNSIPLERTLGNIQKMVDMSNEQGADVFVNLGWRIEGVEGRFGNHNLMPLTPYLKSREEWIPYVEKRRQLQKRIPNEIKNASFINVYDLNQNTSDGIHPNSTGHKMVAEVFADTLKTK